MGFLTENTSKHSDDIQNTDCVQRLVRTILLIETDTQWTRTIVLSM